jgi:hypothetical protein
MSHDRHHEHAAAFAAKRSLSFDGAISESEFKIKTEKFLDVIVSSLKDEGCTLIGHIKGQLDAGENGTLFFGLTTFNGPPRFKGEIKGSIIRAELTINIIVYGIIEESVENLFKKAFRDL